MNALLVDAAALQEVHPKLKVGKRDRRRELHYLNRASIVVSVSAWEGYIEAVVLEAVSSIKPATAPMGLWTVAEAQTEKLIGKFHTLNAINVRRLFAEVLGLTGITAAWKWHKCHPSKASQSLDELLGLRRQVELGFFNLRSIA